MKSILIELIIAALFLVLSVALVNPFDLWMPDTVHMMVLAALVVALGSIYVFIVRERSVDEREDAHRMFAGRVAFFAGSIVLLCGIVLQTLSHALDPWLVAALAGMVAGKAIARMWSGHYQ